jgi:hypothetical protein
MMYRKVMREYLNMTTESKADAIVSVNIRLMKWLRILSTIKRKAIATNKLKLTLNG